MWHGHTITAAVLGADVLPGASGPATADTDLSGVCPDPMRMADTGGEAMGR